MAFPKVDVRTIVGGIPLRIPVMKRAYNGVCRADTV